MQIYQRREKLNLSKVSVLGPASAKVREDDNIAKPPSRSLMQNATRAAALPPQARFNAIMPKVPSPDPLTRRYDV